MWVCFVPDVTRVTFLASHALIGGGRVVFLQLATLEDYTIIQETVGCLHVHVAEVRAFLLVFPMQYSALITI